MTAYRQGDKNLSQSDSLEKSELELIDYDVLTIRFHEGVFDTSWHNHKTHQLLYAEKGVVHFRTETRTYLLPANHGVWIPAGTAHSVHSTTPTLRFWGLYFSAFEPEDDELLQLRIFPISALAHEMIVFTEQWLETDAAAELKISFFETIRLLAKEWCKETLSLELPISNDPLLMKVTEHVVNHLDEPLRLESVANRFGVSGRTLIRYFQKHLGMTFGRYLQVARIAKAAELLTQPSISVTEVAYAVGYHSPSSFTQAFQQLIGQTPYEYASGRKK
ncbi:MAG: helix-turn-helix domain-containing protein [Anaerolineae bacterium]